MDWQEACALSKNGWAVRINHVPGKPICKMYRCKNGEGFREVDGMRKYDHVNLEGYSDWEPEDPLEERET